MVFVPSLELHVVSVYRPPSYLTEENEALARFLVEFSVGKEMVVMGDFNLPSLKWDDENGSFHYTSPTDRYFANCFADCGLTQLVKEGTFFPSGNTLDLILCSDVDRFLDVECVSPLPNCYHCPVVGRMIYQTSILEGDGAIEKFAWSRGDYDALLEDLFDVDWETLFEGLSVDDCYQEFCNKVWELKENRLKI